MADASKLPLTKFHREVSAKLLDWCHAGKFLQGDYSRCILKQTPCANEARRCSCCEPFLHSVLAIAGEWHRESKVLNVLGANDRELWYELLRIADTSGCNYASYEVASGSIPDMAKSMLLPQELDRPHSIYHYDVKRHLLDWCHAGKFQQGDYSCCILKQMPCANRTRRCAVCEPFLHSVLAIARERYRESKVLNVLGANDRELWYELLRIADTSGCNYASYEVASGSIPDMPKSMLLSQELDRPLYHINVKAHLLRWLGGFPRGDYSGCILKQCPFATSRVVCDVCDPFFRHILTVAGFRHRETKVVKVLGANDCELWYELLRMADTSGHSWQ